MNINAKYSNAHSHAWATGRIIHFSNLANCKFTLMYKRLQQVTFFVQELYKTPWLHQEAKVNSLNQPKMKEKEGFKGGESETEIAVPRRQRNKEKKDWRRGELETGPGEQLKQQNKGKHVCNVDVIA